MSGYPTPWKKSRKYGDVYGGRTYPKIGDKVFNRAHSLERPSPQDMLPLIIEENPSRDFFFPLSAEEIVEALKALPKQDYEEITHIWLRRVSKADFIDGSHPLATFICGSGVRVITLYPWPTNMLLPYGSKRPSNRIINEVEGFGAKVKQVGTEWFSEWGLDGLRKYYIQAVLYKKVGFHIDWYYRHWSGPNGRAACDFSDQYAVANTAAATLVFNRLKDNA
jgi:hypothetical protein